MIVDSNALSPLKYTDPTYQASLFVRALIIDTSGVSPVLESTVNLTQYTTSAVYYGKYTFTAGKTYLVIKNVYTDGTYATVDTTYAQDNDDVQCINLRTANLDAAISTRAPASTALDNTVWTNAKAAFIDVAISSRLATAGYTAPDNADILLIKAKTDNLPADPASNTQVNTRNSTSHFDAIIGTPAGASVSADLAEIEAETDGIASIPTNPLLTTDSRLNNLDATISSRNSTAHFDAVIGVPVNASISADIAEVESETDGIALIPTNPLLTTDSRLNHLDADISSRSVLTAGLVWSEDLTSYNTANTAGKDLKLASAGSGGSTALLPGGNSMVLSNTTLSMEIEVNPQLIP